MSADRDRVIDRYLAELDRHLAVPRRYRRRVLSEAADHLTEASEAPQAGAEPAAEAVRRFGPAGRLAADVNAGWASARARRAPVFAFLAGGGVLAAAVAGIPTVPATPAGSGEPVVTACATVAFLALQLAVVAGGVALLRVIARRSAAVLDPADRTLVWQASRLCVAAAALAGAGFLGVASVQAQRTGSSGVPVLLAGAGMVTVLGLVGAVLRRPLPPAASEPSPQPGGRRGVLERTARVGEGAVGLARSWPGPVTAVVAGVCATGSYGHAETGRPGSLLAAAVEATAVVVFARIFGPGLGLRAAPPRDGSPVSG